MSQLIKVDFKNKVVTSKQDLDIVPVSKWEALKDEDFKDWIGGIALMAESCEAMGGNWEQMIVIVHGKPEDERPDFCITMYDQDLMADEAVCEVLATAQQKVTDQTIGESAEGGFDEPA